MAAGPLFLVSLVISTAAPQKWHLVPRPAPRARVRQRECCWGETESTGDAEVGSEAIVFIWTTEVFHLRAPTVLLICTDTPFTHSSLINIDKPGVCVYLSCLFNVRFCDVSANIPFTMSQHYTSSVRTLGDISVSTYYIECDRSGVYHMTHTHKHSFFSPGLYLSLWL